jgi:hypothetical protein
VFFPLSENFFFGKILSRSEILRSLSGNSCLFSWTLKLAGQVIFRVTKLSVKFRESLVIKTVQFFDKIKKLLVKRFNGKPTN